MNGNSIYIWMKSFCESHKYWIFQFILIVRQDFESLLESEGQIPNTWDGKYWDIVEIEFWDEKLGKKIGWTLNLNNSLRILRKNCPPVWIIQVLRKVRKFQQNSPPQYLNLFKILQEFSPKLNLTILPSNTPSTYNPEFIIAIENEFSIKYTKGRDRKLL